MYTEILRRVKDYMFDIAQNIWNPREFMIDFETGMIPAIQS